MAKRAVVEFCCERCPRTWHVPPEEADGAAGSLAVRFTPLGGQEQVRVFEVLCPECTTTVGNYLASALKVRAKKGEEDDPSPPDPA